MERTYLPRICLIITYLYRSTLDNMLLNLFKVTKCVQSKFFHQGEVTGFFCWFVKWLSTELYTKRHQLQRKSMADAIKNYIFQDLKVFRRQYLKRWDTYFKQLKICLGHRPQLFLQLQKKYIIRLADGIQIVIAFRFDIQV